MPRGEAPTYADVSGTWEDAFVEGKGLPGKRVVLVAREATLTGEVWTLLHGEEPPRMWRAGTLAGTLHPDGSAEWSVPETYFDLGGVETVQGRFTGELFQGVYLGGFDKDDPLELRRVSKG